MSAQELDRFQIIKKVIGQHLTGVKAADLLSLSTRQVRRLKAKVKHFGPRGLIHGNRGRVSHNKIDAVEKKKIISLLHKHYHDFKPAFACEKLRENHGLNHDPKTIRRLMIEEGLWRPRLKKKNQPHRAWRERRACYGEMIQFDGSYECWFEERGPKSCLLAAIDDATGQVVYLKFASHEGVEPVFSFWQDYLLKNGKPRAIYLDKFSTYNINHQLAKENSETLTQFERAGVALKIELIKANSPQAKGRVERLFSTLQDRLIKELRLANISTMAAANIFLEKNFCPKFNARFAVEPRNQTNLHQKLTIKELNNLPSIFSRQTERTVLNDFTFSFKTHWYQLTKDQPVTICKKDTVIIEEHLDQTLHIRLRGQELNYRLLPERPKKLNVSVKGLWVLPATKTYIPPLNHPWRQAERTHNTMKSQEQKRTF